MKKLIIALVMLGITEKSWAISAPTVTYKGKRITVPGDYYQNTETGACTGCQFEPRTDYVSLICSCPNKNYATTNIFRSTRGGTTSYDFTHQQLEDALKGKKKLPALTNSGGQLTKK